MAVLKATKRSEIGSKKVARVRRQGFIPGIVYGHGEQPLAISVNAKEVERTVHHGERLIELDLEGQTINVLVKDVQYDNFGSEMLHVDMARVNLDELVEVTVNIHYRGTPVGVTSEDGVFTPVVSEVNIECQVRAIPEEILVTVADMHVGDRLTMGDLKLPEGARLLDDANSVIATVSVVAEEAEAAEGEEGAAEPEVIGAKKEEEEEAK